MSIQYVVLGIRTYNLQDMSLFPLDQGSRPRKKDVDVPSKFVLLVGTYSVARFIEITNLSNFSTVYLELLKILDLLRQKIMFLGKISF